MDNSWLAVAMFNNFRNTSLFLTLTALFAFGCNKEKANEATILGQTQPAQSCGSELLFPKSQLNLAENAATENDESEDTLQTGVLLLGKEIIEILATDLTANSYGIDQVDFIAAVADQQLATTVGTLSVYSDPIVKVIPPVIEGAFFSLNDGCARLSEVNARIETSHIIMTSVTSALKGRTTDLDNEQKYSLIENMSGTSVESFEEAGLTGDATADALTAVTNGTVSALTDAEIPLENIGKAAQNAVLGAVEALKSIGAPTSDIGNFAGTAVSGAMSGLVETGMSSDQIITSGAISNIVSGASSGLEAAGVPDAEVGESIGNIAGFAIRAMESAGIDSVELKEKALADVIDGAVDGLTSDGVDRGSLLSKTLLEVSKEAVNSLLDAGFSVAEITNATNVIIKSGITSIIEKAGQSAGNTVDLVSQVVKGAMEATAALEIQGKIDQAQSAKSGAAAMQSALDSIGQLQSAGKITSAANISAFKSAINTSITDGFTAAGASAESLEVIKNNIQTVITTSAPPAVVTPTPDTTQPTVTSIAITSANGTYDASDSITISVAFSEVVIVTGIPVIWLETGNFGREATYSSGSGTSALTFVYQVQAEDMSAALDYTDQNALALDGGTIKDNANNSAVLTLPVPGGGSSLVAGKQVIINADTISPTVTAIAITTADGSYGVGEAISISISFSETVVVSGVPKLQLETGTTDREAAYSTGSGTADLTFVYQIETGDVSLALDYTDSNALILDGGTISDNADNAANLTLPTPGGGSSLVAGKSVIVSTSNCDESLAGKNLLSSVASGGTTSVKQISWINGASIYSPDNLAMPADCSSVGSWKSQGTFCDDGPAQDSMTASYKSNWSSIATWNSGGVNGVGILVVDLGAVRTFNKLRVFQIQNTDGKTTHVNFYTHPETGSTFPIYTDAGWSTSFLPSEDEVYVSAGDYSVTDYVSNPTAIDLSSYITTRYLKIHARNDGTQGAAGYIELRSVKAFCQ